MARRPIDNSERVLLERVLATYGADRNRWPASDRLRLAGLIAEHAEARAMLAEARALDRLLDMAPVVPATRQQALAARLVAEAGAREQTGSAATAGHVVPLAPRGKALQQRAPSIPAYRAGLARGAPAAALLAASLVTGLVVGWSTLGSSLWSAIGASGRIEISSTAEPNAAMELQQFVFGDDGSDTSEEEFL